MLAVELRPPRRKQLAVLCREQHTACIMPPHSHADSLCTRLQTLVSKQERLLDHRPGPSRLCGGASGDPSTLEATQGKIFSQSPTDATRFWWHLYGS